MGPFNNYEMSQEWVAGVAGGEVWAILLRTVTKI